MSISPNHHRLINNPEASTTQINTTPSQHPELVNFLNQLLQTSSIRSTKNPHGPPHPLGSNHHRTQPQILARTPKPTVKPAHHGPSNTPTKTRQPSLQQNKREKHGPSRLRHSESEKGCPEEPDWDGHVEYVFTSLPCPLDSLIVSIVTPEKKTLFCGRGLHDLN